MRIFFVPSNIDLILRSPAGQQARTGVSKDALVLLQRPVRCFFAQDRSTASAPL